MSDSDPPGVPSTPGLSVMEEHGLAYDPGSASLDLSKEEKLRTTALMMAIHAYKDLIIKDAAYLQTAADLARRNEGPQLRPATINAIVDAAISFERFIRGDEQPADDVGGGSQTETPTDNPA